MQFTDYQAFRVALMWLIEGDELSDTFSVDVLDLMVGLGESRVYRGDQSTPGLRASTMVTPLSVAVTDNAAALPVDLLELKELYFSGEAPLEIISLDRLRAMEADDSAGNTARYAAQDGDSVRFWPTASGTVLGSYYAQPAGLEAGGLNATFNRYAEVFVFATLTAAAGFLGMSDRLAEWEAMWRLQQSGANHAEQMRVWAGGPLKLRAR